MHGYTLIQTAFFDQEQSMAMILGPDTMATKMFTWYQGVLHQVMVFISGSEMVLMLNEEATKWCTMYVKKEGLYFCEVVCKTSKNK